MDLRQNLQVIAFKYKSKSESLEPKSKSKSSKNGLKSGLESKSGLAYYKSVPKDNDIDANDDGCAVQMYTEERGVRTVRECAAGDGIVRTASAAEGGRRSRVTETVRSAPRTHVLYWF